jgi:hypothetical protein
MQNEYIVSEPTEDITTDRNWCREQSDRLASWEILRRHVLHQSRIPMTNDDLCDTIGVSSTYTIRLLKSIRKRLTLQDDE